MKHDPDSNQCQAENADLRSPFKAEDPVAKKGLNRWKWDLRRDAFPCIDNMHMFAGREGARVVPGEYQVRVTLGTQSRTTSFNVAPDPRDDIPTAQFADLDAHLVETTSILDGLIARLDRLRAARDQVETLASLTQGNARHQDIKAGADGIVARIADWEAKVSQPKHEALEDEINYPNMLDAQVMHLLQWIDSADAPVTDGAKARLADLRAEWDVSGCGLSKHCEWRYCGIQCSVESSRGRADRTSISETSGDVFCSNGWLSRIAISRQT